MPDAGSVIVVNFPGVTGMKRRPALILSSDEYHRARPDVIVGLITSQVQAAQATSDCAIQDWKSAGLRLPSAFRAFLTTLPRNVISAQIGTLSKHDWEAVRVCLDMALAR